jgi:hypothetical protein
VRLFWILSTVKLNRSQGFVFCFDSDEEMSVV